MFVALDLILKDEVTFDQLCKDVFKTIDVDGSNSLSKDEIQTFIDNLVQEMMGTKPDEKTLEELFNELDEDGSNDVNCEELREFLKKFFTTQKEELRRTID